MSGALHTIMGATMGGITPHRFGPPPVCKGSKLRHRVPLSPSDGVRVRRGPVGGSVYVNPWQDGWSVYLPLCGPVLLLPDPLDIPSKGPTVCRCIKPVPFPCLYLGGAVRGAEGGPRGGVQRCRGNGVVCQVS